MRKYDIDGETLIKRNATLRSICPGCGRDVLRNFHAAAYICMACGKHINKWVRA